MFPRTLKAHKLKINTQVGMTRRRRRRRLSFSPRMRVCGAASSLIRNEDIYMAKPFSASIGATHLRLLPSQSALELMVMRAGRQTWRRGS